MFKILVVEDDNFISTTLSFFLKSLGHQLVGKCASGAEALELCKKYEPEIVLMDIHIEGNMDGIQTAEKIQRDFEIPVIFVSSDTSEDVVERAIISDSYGYLIKPIQKRDLGITIDLAYYKHKSAMDQKRREQGFRQFISGAAAPIVIVANGRIRYLNMNALDLFHSHYIEDIMGLPLLNFVNDKDKEAFKSVLEQTPQHGLAIPHFKTSIRGLHGKDVDAAVCGSWITFNNDDALQLIMFDISDEKKILNELNLYKKILDDGTKGYLELNQTFEIVNYNTAFQNLANFKTEIKGESIFNLKPVIEIEKDLITENLKNKKITDFDIELKISSKKLKCKVYVFRGKEGEVEKIIIS